MSNYPDLNPRKGENNFCATSVFNDVVKLLRINARRPFFQNMFSTVVIIILSPPQKSLAVNVNHEADVIPKDIRRYVISKAGFEFALII
jgi:hypothetical protein